MPSDVAAARRSAGAPEARAGTAPLRTDAPIAPKSSTMRKADPWLRHAARAYRTQPLVTGNSFPFSRRGNECAPTDTDIDAKLECSRFEGPDYVFETSAEIAGDSPAQHANVGRSRTLLRT